MTLPVEDSLTIQALSNVAVTFKELADKINEGGCDAEEAFYLLTRVVHHCTEAGRHLQRLQGQPRPDPEVA